MNTTINPQTAGDNVAGKPQATTRMPAPMKGRVSKPPVCAFGLDETLGGLPSSEIRDAVAGTPGLDLGDLRRMPAQALEETLALAEMVSTERTPEARGAALFKQIFSNKDYALARCVVQAEEAVLLVTGALTYIADRKAPAAVVRQDPPHVNQRRERVEMVTKIKTAAPGLRGTFTVWAEISGDADAIVGITIRNRWFRTPVQFTASTIHLLLEELARHISLASR